MVDCETLWLAGRKNIIPLTGHITETEMAEIIRSRTDMLDSLGKRKDKIGGHAFTMPNWHVICETHIMQPAWDEEGNRCLLVGDVDITDDDWRDDNTVCGLFDGEPEIIKTGEDAVLGVLTEIENVKSKISNRKKENSAVRLGIKIETQAKFVDMAAPLPYAEVMRCIGSASSIWYAKKWLEQRIGCDVLMKQKDGITFAFVPGLYELKGKDAWNNRNSDIDGILTEKTKAWTHEREVTGKWLQNLEKYSDRTESPNGCIIRLSELPDILARFDGLLKEKTVKKDHPSMPGHTMNGWHLRIPSCRVLLFGGMSTAGTPITIIEEEYTGKAVKTPNGKIRDIAEKYLLKTAGKDPEDTEIIFEVDEVDNEAENPSRCETRELSDGMLENMILEEDFGEMSKLGTKTMKIGRESFEAQKWIIPRDQPWLPYESIRLAKDAKGNKCAIFHMKDGSDQTARLSDMSHKLRADYEKYYAHWNIDPPEISEDRFGLDMMLAVFHEKIGIEKQCEFDPFVRIDDESDSDTLIEIFGSEVPAEDARWRRQYDVDDELKAKGQGFESVKKFGIPVNRIIEGLTDEMEDKAARRNIRSLLKSAKMTKKVNASLKNDFLIEDMGIRQAYDYEKYNGENCLRHQPYYGFGQILKEAVKETDGAEFTLVRSTSGNFLSYNGEEADIEKSAEAVRKVTQTLLGHPIEPRWFEINISA